MMFSVWWVNRFRFGPAEWVWRSLTARGCAMRPAGCAAESLRSHAKGVEQLRNPELVRNLLRKVEQLEAATLPSHRRVRAHDFAEARAVDIGDLGQIEFQLALALIEEAVHLVPQHLVAFAKRDL